MEIHSSSDETKVHRETRIIHEVLYCTVALARMLTSWLSLGLCLSSPVLVVKYTANEKWFQSTSCEFPGCPGLGAFAARAGFNPWWGNKILTSFMAEPKKKKKLKHFSRKIRTGGGECHLFFRKGRKKCDRGCQYNAQEVTCYGEGGNHRRVSGM